MGDTAKPEHSLARAGEIMSSEGLDETSLDKDPTYSYWRLDYHKNMVSVLNAMGRPDEASQHAVIALAMGEDRYDAEKMRAAANADIRFELRERGRELTFAQQSREIALLRLRTANLRTIIGYGGAFLALIAMAFAYRSYRVQRKLATTNRLFLKETQHRAKNNLQILTSMLSIKSRHLELGTDPGLIQRDTAHRLRTMAIIQDQLYHARADSFVQARTLVGDLMDLLSQSMGQDNIKIHADIDDIEVGPDVATTLGLAISELVTNAFKHAFNEDGGSISLKLEAVSQKRMCLSVRDDGVGFEPDSAGIQDTKSLGLSLIDDLCKQMDGKLEFNSGPEGTHWILRNIKTRFG